MMMNIVTFKQILTLLALYAITIPFITCFQVNTNIIVNRKYFAQNRYSLVNINKKLSSNDQLDSRQTKFGSDGIPSSSRSAKWSTAVSLDVDGKEMSTIPFKGIVDDIKRRSGHYKDDWTVSFKLGNRKKTVSAILFMFFTCLAPVVAFGGLTNSITKGQMGVTEFLAGCGLSGMVYSLFSGQPMTFQGPTGLTLAFTTALYAFSTAKNISFYGLYCWTGLWTSALLAICSIFNTSDLIKHCTRFTDDCFNGLISLNFLSEAGKSIMQVFETASRPASWISFVMSLSTWLCTKALVGIRNKKVLTAKWRKYIADFGPSMVIVVLSLISLNPSIRSLDISRLALIPSAGASTMKFAGERCFHGLIPTAIFALPTKLKLLSFFPALLLTLLFYLDQNISVRAVNAFDCLKKGTAYHLDLLVLSFITFGLSLLGLPFTCAATVQSLSHVRAMSNTETNPNTKKELVTSPIESRLSGFVVHLLILLSIYAKPVLSIIPMPVISGLFLHLGFKMMDGNYLFERVFDTFKVKKYLPPSSIYNDDKLERKTIVKYLSVQSASLGLIWFLKQSEDLALLFPSCIALLMITRLKILPKMFSKEELDTLDPAV